MIEDCVVSEAYHLDDMLLVVSKALAKQTHK